MIQLKTIHIGGIVDSSGHIETFVAPTRPKLIHSMNEWFFDFFWQTQQDIKPLPPLDDWSRSKSDTTFWSVNFPEPEWSVWMRFESIQLH